MAILRHSSSMNCPHQQPTLAGSPLAQIASQQQPSRRSARLQNIASTLSIPSQVPDAQNPDALIPSKPSRKRKANPEPAPAHCPIPPSLIQAHFTGSVEDAAKSPAKRASRAQPLLSPSTSASTNGDHQRRAKSARKSVQDPPPDTRCETSPAGKRKGLNNHSEADLQPVKRFKGAQKGVSASKGTPEASQNTEHLAIEEELQNYASPIGYWAAHQTWPNFADHPHMSYSNNTGKRPRRSDASQSDSRSYSQSRKDGKVPQQYTPEYQNCLADQGLEMDILQGRQFVSAESKGLCKDFQTPVYTVIRPSVFLTDTFQQVINYYQNRNEAIVQRNITPLLAPSIASLLFGGDQSVEHLCDEVDSLWYTQCILFGPVPKPDLAIGLSRSAFNRAELEKLDRYKSSDNWTQVTRDLFFPFLICEVKCGNEGLDRADRQNMHSCSVAVRAILRVVQEADRYRSEKMFPKLDGQILVFSMSHDQKDVRLYGHYAICTEDKWSYYRYAIETYNILMKEDGLLLAHNFIRNVLNTYASIHMERLRQAISALPEPSGLSFSASALTVDEESQELSTEAETAPDIEYDGDFRKPDLPPVVKQQNAMNKMRQQIDKLIEQLREKDEKAQQQQEKTQQQMDNLLQQLRDKDEKAQQQQEKAQQQMDKLIQQLEQQRRDGREEREKTMRYLERQDLR